MKIFRVVSKIDFLKVIIAGVLIFVTFSMLLRVPRIEFFRNEESKANLKVFYIDRSFQTNLFGQKLRGIQVKEDSFSKEDPFVRTIMLVNHKPSRLKLLGLYSVYLFGGVFINSSSLILDLNALRQEKMVFAMAVPDQNMAQTYDRCLYTKNGKIIPRISDNFLYCSTPKFDPLRGILEYLCRNISYKVYGRYFSDAFGPTAIAQAINLDLGKSLYAPINLILKDEYVEDPSFQKMWHESRLYQSKDFDPPLFSQLKAKVPLGTPTKIPNINIRTGAAEEDKIDKMILSNYIKGLEKFGYEVKYFSDPQVVEYMYKTEYKIPFDLIVPGALKADLFRLCALYEYGGIYNDICQEYVCSKAELDSLLEGCDLIFCKDRFRISREGCIYEDISWERQSEDLTYKHIPMIHNAFMVATPKNPVILFLIKYIVNNILLQTYGTDPLEITGPLAVGQALNLFFNRPIYATFPEDGSYTWDGYRIKFMTHLELDEGSHLWYKKQKLIKRKPHKCYPAMVSGLKYSEYFNLRKLYRSDFEQA